MNFLDAKRLIDLPPLTGEQENACLILEAMGKRFCVDFGYENAVSKLADLVKEIKPASLLIN